MTREEIVAALREHAEWAAGNEWETPITLGDDISVAADLIENQQREIDALRQAVNPSVTLRVAPPLSGEARAVEDASPYETDGDGPDSDEICRAALEAFGAETQITMVFEEMAELQDALCKFLRGRVDDDTRTHIAEEIADVEIMLCQMVMLFDCAGQVETFRRYKLERLAGRIKEEKHEHE